MISNVKVYGLEESVRRAKFAMSTDTDSCTTEITDKTVKLANAPIGSGHDCFLKGIVVQFDLEFTIKAWTEAERYNWFDIITSQSTMHRLTKFDLDKTYIKYVDPRIIEIMKEKVNAYNQEMWEWRNSFVPQCVEMQQRFHNKMEEKFLEIVYSNPTGCKLTAGMTTNYLQLKTIYAQRKNHRLPEWKEFCKWIETLPHSEFITAK